MPELQIGKAAPKFSLPSNLDKKIALKDYAGQKVVIYFYPKDMTPGCTQESCDFRDSLTKFKRKKVAVLGVSMDSVERHQKFVDKYGLNFPLLADEDAKVCKAYGVYQKKSMYGKSFMGIVRSTFIIDTKGKVAKIFTKVKVKGHVDEVLEALKDVN